MEDLQRLSPASRQAKLDALPRADIQKLAKEAGLKANGKTVDIISNLLEKLSSTAGAPAADLSKESTLPAATQSSPIIVKPPAPSQGTQAHSDTMPASESLPPSGVDATTTANLSSHNPAGTAPPEAAVSTPSRSCVMQQQDVLPLPTTSARGGSKRRNKGPKAMTAAKKPKSNTAGAHAADSSGQENAKEEVQTTPAPSKRNPPRAAEAAVTDSGAVAASTREAPAESVQPSSVIIAEHKGDLRAPPACLPDAHSAEEVLQEAAQPLVTATEPTASQPTAATAAQAAAYTGPALVDDAGLPGGRPEAQESAAPLPELAEPTPQPGSVPHKGIAPVNPAASPTKPDTEMEEVSMEKAAPACQTELLPALDAAPDASTVQATDPVDDWIVDPDEVAAAEAHMQMADADGSDMLSGVLGEEDSRVLSALLNPPLTLPASAQKRCLPAGSNQAARKEDYIGFPAEQPPLEAAQALANAEQAPSCNHAASMPQPSHDDATQQALTAAAPEQPSEAGKQAHTAGASKGPPLAGDMSEMSVIAGMEVTAQGPAVVTAEGNGWVSNPMFEEPPEAVQQSAKQSVLGVGSGDAEAAEEQAMAMRGSSQIVAVGGGRPPSGRLRCSGVEGSGDVQKHAFERGRKSGIWHGATQVQLHQLENEWDSYKSCSTRGWTLPSMEDVQAESERLTAAGFTTVDTPVLGRTSRNAILKRQGASKRKASEETDGSRPSSGKIARRSESQGAPNSAQCSQLRASRFGTKENAGVSTPSRLSHMTKGAQTPLKMDVGDSADSATPSHAARQEAGTPGGKAARAGAAKASGQQQQNRAQKAEQQFAARRAAALAKVKK